MAFSSRSWPWRKHHNEDVSPSFVIQLRSVPGVGAAHVPRFLFGSFDPMASSV